jgi:hypothetical protein
MNLDFEQIFKLLQKRTIILFQNPKLKYTNKRHFHIIAGINKQKQTLMLVTTSQEEKVIKRIEKLKLPTTSLVFIKPDTRNNLTKNSFVDCNNGYFEFSYDELKKIYFENEIKFIGEISEQHFEQIIIGLNDSPLVEPIILKKFDLLK